MHGNRCLISCLLALNNELCSYTTSWGELQKYEEVFLSDSWWHWLARSAMDDMFLHWYLTFFHHKTWDTKGDVLSCPGTLFSVVPVNGLLSLNGNCQMIALCGEMLKFKCNSDSHSFKYATQVSRQWHQHIWFNSKVIYMVKSSQD